MLTYERRAGCRVGCEHDDDGRAPDFRSGASAQRCRHKASYGMREPRRLVFLGGSARHVRSSADPIGHAVVAMTLQLRRPAQRLDLLPQSAHLVEDQPGMGFSLVLQIFGDLRLHRIDDHRNK